MRAEARKLLAWQAIKDEDETELDPEQRGQLGESIRKAQRDLRESSWRAYKNVLLLGKDNSVQTVDLGLLNSSQSSNLTKLIVDRLRQDGEIETNPSASFIVRNWPPAFREWSTRSLRDAFFSSPQFPRLLVAEALKDTIARGVSSGIIGYAARTGSDLGPVQIGTNLLPLDVEVSDETFILRAEDAKKLAEPPRIANLRILPERPSLKPGASITFQAEGLDRHGRPISGPSILWHAKGGVIDDSGKFTAGKEEGAFEIEAVSGEIRGSTVVSISEAEREQPQPPKSESSALKGIRWSGEVTPQKWTTFYTKVLARFAGAARMKLTVTVEISADQGLSPQRVDETNAALRELGLDGEVEKIP